MASLNSANDTVKMANGRVANDRSGILGMALYRTVWRWHLYAGLFTVPFLFILAVTGSIYVFHTEIENWLYHDLRNVVPAGTATMLSVENQVAAAQAARPRLIVATRRRGANTFR